MRGLNTFNLEGDEYITLKKLISSSSRILKKKIEINENNPNDISKRKISNKVEGALRIVRKNGKVQCISESLKKLISSKTLNIKVRDKKIPEMINNFFKNN